MEAQHLMWVSRRTDYATRAVLALAMADTDKPMRMEELSRRTQVPPSVLEQIMPLMRNDGIVRSERGRYGGYVLNHRPEQITMERVVRLFEGQLAPISCATRVAPEPCPMAVGCSLRFMWEDVRDVILDRLSNTTFADLAGRAGGPWKSPDQLQPV
jgi:Rrf2 family protein